MSLGQRLKGIADGLTAKAPDASAALHGFIDDLRATGIADRVLKVGEPAPDFELEATDGRRISLDSLVARRPVILSFHRGRW